LQIRIGSVSVGDDTQWVSYSSREHANAMYHPVIEITTSGGGSSEPQIEEFVSVEQNTGIPNEFTLEGNYPNPFNPSTTIMLNLPQAAVVKVEIYNMMGRQVTVLPARNMVAGTQQQFMIDASSLASGVYLYRVIAQMNDEVAIRVGRMTFLK